MVHHIALGARDVQNVATFYQSYFNVPEVRRHVYEDGRLRSVWLDCGGFVLMVEHVDAPDHEQPPMRPGLFLLAFAVNPSERESLERRLVDGGHAIESRTEKTSYTHDPERNRVAFSTYDLYAKTHT